MGIIGLVMLLGLVLNGCGGGDGGGDGGGGSGGGGSGGGGGNTAPQPAAAAITTSTNTPGTSQISVNDSDVGQTFTFVLTTPPQNGTATVSAAGLVTFTPRAGFTGSDQLTVTVTDNGSPPLSGTVTISLTVQAPPSASRIVGRLLVPPNNAVEVEPNNVISQAQTLSSTATVSGSAARGEPGFLLPGFTGVVLQDLYQVTTTGKVRITLTIATDDLDANDLDLVLMNSAGTLLDVSEGFVATETLDIPGAGTFLVGIRAFAGSSAYILSFTTPEGRTSSQAALVPSEAEFVAGDILVKFRPDKINLEQQTTAFATAYGLSHIESLPPDVEFMHVSLPTRALAEEPDQTKIRLAGSAENALKALTLDTIRRLSRDPDVEYAEPNFIRQATRVPNDPEFPVQWHYRLINLPDAWDITTGSDQVIVAVIDTGILVNHPDLNARLIAGFDFIGNPDRSNDNDGIDADANDPGDDPRGLSSSFHGTHVAGTIGATTDNGVGVAGVTWQTRIMPLRALGVRGGTDADVTQAIRYAAGLSNASGTLPARRANVINLSLGSQGRSQTQQDAILAARNQGVIVVAAAGNDNISAFFSPASLDGVISVAAVDLNSAKAPYSNFGSGIDVAAPGGNINADLNGDRRPDGVLSTLGAESPNMPLAFTYQFYNGTSMAAPHVAGVIALMLAVNPNLTPTDIDQLLAGTHPRTTRRMTRDLGVPGRDDIFGHGLIDAAAAVAAAREIPGGQGPTPGGSILAVSTGALNFDNFLNALAFEISNAGSGTLAITSITANVPWLTLTPTSGTAPLRVTATADRAGLTPGAYRATITVASNATQGTPTATLNVDLIVGGNTQGNVGTVFILVLNMNTLGTVAQAEATAAQNYNFTTPTLPPGTYFVVAGTDRDDDNFICDIEDACGVFPDPVTVVAGQELRGVDFVVGNLIEPQSAPTALVQGAHDRFKRLR